MLISHAMQTTNVGSMDHSITVHSITVHVSASKVAAKTMSSLTETHSSAESVDIAVEARAVAKNALRAISKDDNKVT